MPRIAWDQLPVAARAAVAECTGPIHAATTATSGANSGIAVRLRTTSGGVFVKGMPSGHTQVRTQQREAEINPYLPASSPRLLWHVEAAGWDLLGFELVNGRIADFAPGSADLPRIIEALDTLARVPCPALPLKRVDQRWAAYTNPCALPLLDGNCLLHTDMAPHNILIDHTDGHARLIDWAWPTRGPAWVDPAVWVIRLIDAGHSPAGAEDWAARLPAWQTAPPAAVTAFAHANAQLWEELANQDPAAIWKKQMAASARYWSTHRANSSSPT